MNRDVSWHFSGFKVSEQMYMYLKKISAVVQLTKYEIKSNKVFMKWEKFFYLTAIP